MCRQPFVNVVRLEEQMADEVGKTTLAPPVLAWLLERVARSDGQRDMERSHQLRSLDAGIASHETQSDALTKMRMKSLITDEDFLKQRDELQRTLLMLKQRQDKIQQSGDWIEPATRFILFCSRAAEYFRRAPATLRRDIVSTVGSNLTIVDRIFSFEAAKPFRLWDSGPTYSEMCTFLEDVRTLASSHDPVFEAILAKIKTIEEGLMESETSGQHKAAPGSFSLL
jgi:hypothetical protein